MAESPHVFEASAENFQELILEKSMRTPVLVDFWAAWCGPCQILVPILEKLVEEYQGKFVLAKVNADEQAQLASEYGVRSLPTVKLFKHGQVVDEFMGAQPESAIREVLDRHIERESDKVCEAALDALRSGDPDKARALISQAINMDPTSSRVQLDEVRILIAAGDHEQAAAALQRLPMNLQSEPQVAALKAALEFERIAASAPEPETLQQLAAENPDNSEAPYQLSAVKVLSGDYEGAMELLLSIMRRDRSFGDDAARKRLLDVFTMLGGQGELVNRYRSKMSALLY